MNRIPFAFLSLLGIVFCAFTAYEWCRAPLTSWYGKSFGISDSLLGFIVGASTMTGIFLKFPAGVLSDVVGRKRVLILGTVFFAFTPLAYKFATSPWLLLGVRFLHGCATAIYGPAALAIVADLFKERRGEAIGWYTAVASCGKALGATAVGWAFVQTGQAFPVTYLLASPVGFVAFALALFIPLKDDAPKSVEPVGAQIRRSFLEACREGRVIFTAVIDGVVAIAAGAIQAFLPLYAISHHSPERVSMLFGVQIVTSLFTRPFMGMASDRLGRKPMIVSGMILAAISFAALTQTMRFEALLVLAGIFGLAEAVIHTSTSAFAADICRQKSLGSAMGIFGSVSDVGHALGPILTGALLVALGGRFDRVFLIVGGLVVLAAVLFGALVRSTDRPVR